MAENGEAKSSKRQRPLSVWELPKLLQSVHSYRKGSIRSPKERPHFPGNLAYIYSNRLAISTQIQRRFSKFLRSDRTTRRHLAEMESLGYLDVAPTNNTSPLWPKVYFVTKRGLKRLKEEYAKRGQTWKPYLADRKRLEGISAQHVLHELFTTEFLLMLWETDQRRDDFELLKVERRSLVKHRAFRFGFAGQETRLEPDGMFLYRQNGLGMMLCFAEIDMGTMSPNQLKAKFQRYYVWSQSQAAKEYVESLYTRHGAKNPRMAFRMLMLKVGAKDDQIEFSQELLAGLPEGLLRNLWFCSGASLSGSVDLTHDEEWEWIDGTGNSRRLFSG